VRDEVLYRVKEKRDILLTVDRKKTNWLNDSLNDKHQPMHFPFNNILV